MSFLGLVFAVLIGVMLALAAWRPRAERWTMADVKAVDMTPWRGAPWAGAVLVITVIAIYAAFAE